MMRKVCCLLFVVLLVGWACAQAEPPGTDQVAQAPPTVDPQAAQPRAPNAWQCEVLAAPGSPSMRQRHICGNNTGKIRLITNVACITETGTTQFTPQLTGGEAQSILASPLSCSPTWAEGTLNGQPRVRSFTKAGMTCASTCSIDFAISGSSSDAAGIVLVINGTYE